VHTARQLDVNRERNEMEYTIRYEFLDLLTVV